MQSPKCGQVGRGKAEAASAAQAQRFQLLADSVPGVVYLCRHDATFSLLYLNDRVQDLTGFSKEEFLHDRLRLIDLQHPDDAPAIRSGIAHALSEQRAFHLTYRLRHCTGAWRWVEEFGRGVFDDAHEQVLFLQGFLSDVTERKQAEEALRESRSMLQLVLDNIPARVFWKDRHSVFLGCNRVFAADAGGESPEDIIGRTDYDLAWKREEAEFYRACDRRVMEADQPEYHIIEPQLQADGKQAWLDTHKVPLHDARGQVVGILGTYEDITERKRAEDQLLRERHLFIGGPVVVLRWLAAPEWPVEYVSPNVAGVFGYAADDFLAGRIRYATAIHPEDRARVASEIESYIQAGVACYEQNYRIVRPDGSVRWLDDFTVVVRDEGGQVVHFDGYVLDVTERRQAEEQQRRLETRIQQSQKLESLGILAGGIAHDFNNLLVGVLGNAGLALLELPPDSPARATIERIEVAAQRAADLTQQMLAYSGRGKFITDTLDLSRLVEEIAHLLRVSISKKAALRFELAPHLPPVRGDATQIRQVVMNVITNASDALGNRNGDIVVSTGVKHADRAFLQTTQLGDNLPEGCYVSVEVSDTGCGMDADTLSRMFDPFFTTKFSGRGLGLSAVLGIVRGHRGALRVESAPGRGTTFQVLFPSGETAGPSREALEGGLTMPEQSWHGTGTILVVDDEEAVRTVARMALERFGFEVLTADDGPAALELFTAHADRIVAVLLDLTMPQMSGEEVFQELHRLRPDVPVILSSGFNEQDAVSGAPGDGPAAFVQKPYRPLELIDKLRAVLKTK
jgi:two-component system, cell cycle sensor histidine kinase and response regulator CckA